MDKATSQLLFDVREQLQPPVALLDEPKKSQRRLARWAKEGMEKGVTVTSVTSGYFADQKHYILSVGFPDWQMEGAKKIQQSFGQGIGGPST